MIKMWWSLLLVLVSIWWYTTRCLWEQIECVIVEPHLTKRMRLSKIRKILFDFIWLYDHSYMGIGSTGLVFQLEKMGSSERQVNDLDGNIVGWSFLKTVLLMGIGLGRVERYRGQWRWYLDMTPMYNRLRDEIVDDFSIEFFWKSEGEGYPNSTFSITELLRNDGLVRDEFGMWVFSLETTLRWKRSMGREKDLSDIELIQKIMSNPLS
jgi:hypothetical protein